MHGHDTDLATLADEDTRHRMVDGARRMNSRRKPPYWTDWIPGVSIENRGRIEPAAARGIEQPSSIVIGRPPPRLKTNPGPAKRGIHDPLPVGEGRPAKARAERPPAISIGTTVGKGTIGIEISEPGRVVRRTRVLQRRACGVGNAIDTTGNPAIKVIFIWKAADGQGRIADCLDGEGLAVVEPRLILIVQNRNAALISLDRAAVVEIIQAKSGSRVGFHGEVAAGNAEVVAASGIHVERSAALAKNEARGVSGIVERKIVELQDGVFLEESHGAVLEFHFRAALVRGKNVTLADRQIQIGGFPRCAGIRKRVAVRLAGEANVALNEAQADDAGMAGIRRGGMRACK